VTAQLMPLTAQVDLENAFQTEPPHAQNPKLSYKMDSKCALTTMFPVWMQVEMSAELMEPPYAMLSEDSE